MRTKLLVLTAIAALGAIVTGCVETVDGRTQAGVPFVKDKVENRYERSVAQVVEASRAVISFNGKLVGDNTINNSLQGRVNQEDVFVRVTEVDAAKPVCRVEVQVRTRAGGRDLDLAHDLATQIALQLSGH